MKPGGRIAYVTCSVLAEENGDQVRAFLARHPDFAVVPPAEVAGRARRARLSVPPRRADVGRGPADDAAAHRHRRILRVAAGAACVSPRRPRVHPLRGTRRRATSRYTPPPPASGADHPGKIQARHCRADREGRAPCRWHGNDRRPSYSASHPVTHQCTASHEARAIIVRTNLAVFLWTHRATRRHRGSCGPVWIRTRGR